MLLHICSPKRINLRYAASELKGKWNVRHAMSNQGIQINVSAKLLAMSNQIILIF